MMAEQAVKQLHEACEGGQVATIRQLLNGGVPVDALDENRSTPLHTAIQNEQREAVGLLLDRGANIEAVARGLTPLLNAIWGAESEDLAGLLLDRGASAHAVDEYDGRTALHGAASKGLLILMARLIDMGLSVDVRDNNGSTPLIDAAYNDKKGAFEIMLGRGAAINAQRNDGYTALHWACSNGYTESAKVLLLRGADPTIKNNEGDTAFEVFGDDDDVTGEQKAAAVSALKDARGEYLLGRNAVLESRVAVLERPARTYASSLLFSERVSDVVFFCGSGGDGGDRIHAHRNIVSACSEQLSALLQGQWAETTGGERERVAEVEMSQSGAAVRALLRFMYTGEAEAAALDANLQEVLDLAALYEQVDLKAACEERSIEGLAVKTVVPLLICSHLHDLGKLKQACIDLIKVNWAAVLTSISYMNLQTTHPALFTEMRAALGAGGEEEKEKDDEGPGQKRSRVG